MEIHEILEYETTQYHHSTRYGGFLWGYIDHFLKIKAASSGFSKNCKTQEHKSEYIQAFFDREGVQLDESKIMHNPSLSMSKI